MMADKESPKKPIVNNSNNSKKKKKKKRGGAKRKMTFEQTVAYKSVREWVFLDRSNDNCNNSTSLFDSVLDDFGVQWSKYLLLTDHDTMSGIPEALEAARRFGIKIIPGVEISTMFSTRGELGPKEPVHILAYYSSCGPKKSEAFEKFLGDIRDGRFIRAKNMISKLNKLKLPLKWENVIKIAGKGVAPGRLHLARAMLEAGHVDNLKQAFTQYLYDGGPAYSMGSEPVSEEAVELIRETGGIAVLAHPWALKNPATIIRRLKEAGLHGLEAYRSDGKLEVYSAFADAQNLLKLGGSDYHGRSGQHESEVGSVSLPVMMVHEFLKVARPIWCNAIKEILETYVKDPSDSNLQLITRFGQTKVSKGISPFTCVSEFIKQCLSTWLSKEERESAEFEAIKLELSRVSVSLREFEARAASK
ncbi:polymerase/histidinol phosphatase-like [Abeliophyllum distichum]|uniref:Polymerase/histidinol phosphatase-like n=1 Tax=Abeliophyllum distichum TaxID=126358 RepID=A0ABD1P978_9LAMI